MVTALFAASSQPLIAWSMAGLSGAFLDSELSYEALFRNILILLCALFIAWFADNIKANLLLDSEFELRRQVFDSIYAMPIDEFEKKDSGAYYNQIGRDTQILSRELFEGTLKVIVNGLSIGLIAVLLLYCHWMSFLIILIFLLPLTVNNLLMPQQGYIFDDTIRCNLDQKGTCTDEELPAIISKVKLDRFFAANGYTLDTQISNETLQVSGGEKARIGLARSLTLHKSIVISHIIHRPATRTDMMLSCGLRFKMIRKNGWNTDGYDSARGILCNFLLPKFY